ncbi:M24 family metallopeptidase [Parachitinimonas caeni]|uniref:M24 family metallopeptidase n=1 Tax=Parachitinimonas caeni TaxID=3031301 RepID=A0ABT7E136_9NEIS|nr:M24 family metallopeptidase [Parachitinimonas caeni]MDK2126032.1 M24 family metallopeptidase [Parachitinimonas caeni]
MPFFIKELQIQPNKPDVNENIYHLANHLKEIYSNMLNGLTDGVSTRELSDIAHATARSMGISLTFKEVQGFPDGVSISVNHESANGVPDKSKIIKTGDMVKVAIGVGNAGQAFCVQNSTVVLGKPTLLDSLLIAKTKKCLQQAIAVCLPGNRVSDIVQALDETAKQETIFISKLFCGHMIGTKPILAPAIIKPKMFFGKDYILQAGCMVSVSVIGYSQKPNECFRQNRWTVYEKNGLRSAAFSHVVMVDEGGVKTVTAELPVCV